MSEENKLANRQKLPKVVVGIFIFNNKGELFLMNSPKWKNQYTCPGGGIEPGETIIESAKREVKEETNMEIDNIELITAVDGLGLEKSYTKPENHLIFLDHRATVKKADKIKLNKEGTEYKWLKPDEWNKRKDVEKYTKYVISKYLLDEINFEDKYKRALADYQNLLKRTAQEKQDFVKYANEGLLHEIIPVYDNLKMSLAHADENADKNGWLEGVKHVIKQFREILKSLGVEEIETKGKKFNPELMEAVDGKGDKVKQEIKPGYKLHGKVVIPAKVILK